MTEKKGSPLVVVTGPTASGKTSIGVEIAAEFNGEIISVDSRQLYRGMDLGTGKDLNEYSFNAKNVPYHLIDIIDPGEKYTLYNYIDDFYASYRKIKNKGRLSVAVGGTGLYLEAVLAHYRIPDVPVNNELRQELSGFDADELRKRLENLDLDLYGKTDVSSKKRIIRSIEIALYSRENKIRYAGENFPSFDSIIIALAWPKVELIKRIDERIRQRLDAGMIEEVRGLLQQGVPAERLIFFGLEYKFITEYVTGRINREQMIESLITGIHRFAKRQMTWFRGMEKRGFRISWVRNGDRQKVFEMVSNFIKD